MVTGALHHAVNLTLQHFLGIYRVNYAQGVESPLRHMQCRVAATCSLVGSTFLCGSNKFVDSSRV